ncbi:MBL fold metallo-hydrolase [Pseudomonas sichuanensis]|uniref:MBL fold metallo-hydrolase n=1 Tax=Pseudomonas sichuanensis TaxID=2213015 RepID=UPI00244B0F6E|nr:MBL fold metallo-hydrolase [Pseudomonas sichuanensis]MDH0732264.1 MBL fold metallo-hydrolase [Pseudomonas sichuanensis]MDH1582899.1 MBL fold metallo-hydrolase [Pseudomonas sichuanensis]MDH1593216.1 MBL fold metallo-hydrolase [Pseudomonas sichuanensis]MDH1598037.1 MBL fold metallo-hydrolase [Pseudomonas sichuanensis]
MKAFLLLGVFLLMAPMASSAGEPAPHRDGRFHNQAEMPQDGVWKKLRIGFKYLLLRKPPETRPATAPGLQPMTRQQVLDAPDHSLWRLGHSTVLLKLRGRFFITDPVFAERASPVQWAGPLRFHAPPLALDDLPALTAVILSHDHFDHLDEDAIRRLAPRTEHFLAPLGVGDLLIEWGVPAAKVRQLDWWQQAEIEGVRFIATPAQHFSGRGLFDSNHRLWASWVMIDEGMRLFFSGDTGYFEGFREIGERFGPFDLTLMETGAYNLAWPNVHMQPEQSLQAHLDLRGRWLLPIHNGTFDLSIHAWEEPFERILALANAAQVQLSTPQMGERVSLDSPHAGQNWWRPQPLRRQGKSAQRAVAVR